MAASSGKQKSPKKLCKDLFGFKAMARPMYIPLIYRYASKISQVPVEDMLKDPLKLSKGLIMAQELFGYDAIVTNYDNYLGIELLARSFDWVDDNIINELVSKKRKSLITDRVISANEIASVSVVYESCSQLCEVVSREVPVIGVLNSPVTLVNMILSDDWSSWEGHKEDLRQPLNDAQGIIVDLIKAYCNCRVDAIWLIEEDWSKINGDYAEWLIPLYQTFWNVTQYYDVKSIMAFHRYNQESIEQYFRMGSDAVFFGGNEAVRLSVPTLAEYGDRYGVCVGLGCPISVDEQQKVQTEELLESVKEIGQGFFLSTAWEVDDELPVELIHDTTSRVIG